MGRLLWRLCAEGHEQRPSRVEWYMNRPWPQRKCRLCVSAKRKLRYQVRKELIQINSTRRAGPEHGLISQRPEQGIGTSMPADILR
jgi:hypothetical protein